MGIKADIDYREISKVTQQLHGITLRAQDIRPAAPAIRLLVQQDVDLRFQSSPTTQTGGEVYGGVYWKPLSEAYLAANPRRYNGQILRDTGELAQSLTADGHPYNIWEVTNDAIVFGTALAKAPPLQRDRPFIFWHAILIEKIADYLARWIGG